MTLARTENLDLTQITPAQVSLETFQVIPYQEIERLAEAVLGMPSYNIPYASNYENDACYIESCTQAEWIDPEYQEGRSLMELYLAGDDGPDSEFDDEDEDEDEYEDDDPFLPTARHILCALIERGTPGLTWGKYLVTVSW